MCCMQQCSQKANFKRFSFTWYSCLGNLVWVIYLFILLCWYMLRIYFSCSISHVQIRNATEIITDLLFLWSVFTSPCDSNKKNPAWERSHEVLLYLYSNPNPPMQSTIQLCQKISYGNQRPLSFYCSCPKWKYRCEHSWAQNYGPWPEVTYAVPKDLIRYRGRFNMFMFHLTVWLTMAPKDCRGTQWLLGGKSLLF